MGSEETLKLDPLAISWREIDGEAVLLDLKKSRYLSINKSGTVLWRLIADGTTRSALIEALRETCGVDEARAVADVDAFICDARTNGLLPL